MKKEKYMSGSEFRQLVHISTRKMKYLMDHDYVPHINTGNATHKYLIRREDAEDYIRKMETDPSFLAELNGIFTSRKEHHPKPLFEATDRNVNAFHEWLEREWADLPEAVSPKEIAQRIGVTGNTINYLVREGKIAAVTVMGKRLCIKQSVIDYYASAEKLTNPADEAYQDLIRAFKKRQCRERENERRRKNRKRTENSKQSK